MLYIDCLFCRALNLLVAMTPAVVDATIRMKRTKGSKFRNYSCASYGNFMPATARIIICNKILFIFITQCRNVNGLSVNGGRMRPSEQFI